MVEEGQKKYVYQSIGESALYIQPLAPFKILHSEVFIRVALFSRTSCGRLPITSLCLPLVEIPDRLLLAFKIVERLDSAAANVYKTGL